MKGFVDYLFEHQGRVYVCDFKGDRLAAWDAEALAAYCVEQYHLQERIYALAALRLCGIATPSAFARRFGGVLFAFLRGMRADDGSAGVCFHLPTWDEVNGWEREMLDPAFWGMT